MVVSAKRTTRGKMFVQVLKPGYLLCQETLATSEVPSAEADYIAQMPGCAGHFTRDTKRVPPVGSWNLSACACTGSLRLMIILPAS
jgi:hypothetical protein